MESNLKRISDRLGSRAFDLGRLMNDSDNPTDKILCKIGLTLIDLAGLKMIEIKQNQSS